MNYLLSALLCAGAATTLMAQEPPPPLAGQTSAYARALQGTLDRVRERVGKTVDIWKDRSTWENAWVAQTDHFAVRTTRSYGFGMKMAEGLEVMLGHFQNKLGMDFAPETPLRVSVFPDLAAYNAFGGNADEHSSFYGSFYAAGDPERPVAALYDNNETRLNMWITHSVVHQYLAAAYPNATPPTWISEGLAAYFSSFWAYDWGLDEWERIRSNTIPLSQLFTDQLPAYVSNSHERFIKLGVLFQYLILYREDTRTTAPDEEEQRGLFRDYLAAAIRGEIDTDSPVHALVTQPRDLEQALLEFEFPR